MAVLRIDHVPETVKVNLPLNLILPDPGGMGGVPSEYHEEDGAHDWFFGDRQIRRFLTLILGPL